MIIVTGATGQLGRQVVQHLVKLVSPSQVAVSVREPAQAADLAALGVRVRRGDFAEPASLREAFEGAAQVLLISSNARATGGDTLAQHQAAIDAARRAGARRILYTSHMAASATSEFPPMRDHAATEAMLRAAELPFIALRHGFYASSGLMLLGDALKTGSVEAPEDGKVSWTTHADLAEADARILADPGYPTGPTAPLTAAEALDLADIAQLAAQVVQRPIERRLLADDALRTRLLTRGLPADVVDISLGLYKASRRGEFAAVDPTLGKLLGRAPTTLRAFIAATAATPR